MTERAPSDAVKPRYPRRPGSGKAPLASRPAQVRPLLITGAAGTLGRAFARLCEAHDVAHRLLTRQDLDLASPAAIVTMLTATRPWAVINAAGYVRIDAAETEAAACTRDNTAAATNLALACAAQGIQLLTFSTDMVFDGHKTTPYLESDPAAPLNHYGRCKRAAELGVLAALPEALVIRTSAFFGPSDPHNFAIAVLRTLHAGHSFLAADDLTVSPTYVPDLVQRCLGLLLDQTSGIGHLSSGEAVTWAAFARRIAAIAGLSAARVAGVPHTRLGLIAARPAYAALGSERGWSLPSLDDALHRWLTDLDPQLSP